MKQFSHQPVMLAEVLDLLQVGPGKTYVDGTLGLGGHTAAILEKTQPGGLLIGIDRDPEALKIAQAKLKLFGNRMIFKKGSFHEIQTFLQEENILQVDGMLLDLGVSSMQLEDIERGFSFLRDSALDMRMDLEEKVTARELLQKLSAKDLETIFRDYGEERFSRRIAQLIVRERQKAPLRTTGELKALVSRAVPFYKTKIHPATRVFQALRIAVNQELNILRSFLKDPPTFLRGNGVLAVLTYHSLEDRIVKHAFRSYEGYQVLTKKPMRPTREETLTNPRSRSAKLRGVMRL